MGRMFKVEYLILTLFTICGSMAAVVMKYGVVAATTAAAIFVIIVRPKYNKGECGCVAVGGGDGMCCVSGNGGGNGSMGGSGGGGNSWAARPQSRWLQ